MKIALSKNCNDVAAATQNKSLFMKSSLRRGMISKEHAIRLAAEPFATIALVVISGCQNI